MEKQTFDSMQAVYELSSSYIIGSKDNYQSVFSLIWQMNAYFLSEKNHYCFLLDRSDVKINGEAPEILMDKVICEIGNSLYPLSLEVSPSLRIIGIANFEELKERWKNVTDGIIEKYPSKVIKDYILRSEKSLETPRILIDRLYQDIFFNIYFRDIYTLTERDEGRLMVWQNFPENESNQSYLYQVSHPAKQCAVLSGEIMKITPEQNGELKITYETGNAGEIKQITGTVETNWQEKMYIKQIAVSVKTITLGK